ncbi:hypothetical protein IV203_009190 [Nitzschia inconspicua]|uniref:Uncharacterized protein n=1 Tax=Nitzschia inconspicua TaxID=303405 RepID=A0A9K3PMR9_9STRA|nr:hypothetical protein IV203_009190 [Nitzschia inconspicua]
MMVSEGIEIMEVIREERRSPSPTSKKPGWKRRAAAGRNVAYPVGRKASFLSNTSSSVATTKSLSSNTDFTLPSPTNSQGKPKWNTIDKIAYSGEISDIIKAIPEDDDARLDSDDEFECTKQQSTDSSLLGLQCKTNPKPKSGLSHSIRSGCSGTSYGSLTLAGATSLSSTDTFQNSSIPPLDHVQRKRSILKRDEAEDVESQATLTHSNANSPNRQLLPHSIQHYHLHGYSHQPIVEEGDWSSSSSEEDNKDVHEIRSNPQSIGSPKRAGRTKRKKGSLSPKKNTKKISSSSPSTKNKSPAFESSSKKQLRSPTTKAKQQRNRSQQNSRLETASSPITKDSQTESPKLNDNIQMSYMSSKWTNNSLANAPAKLSSHWANVGSDLSLWQSSDDDSSVEKPPTAKTTMRQPTAQSTNNKKRFPKYQSNWKSPLLFDQENSKPINARSSLPEPKVATGDVKPVISRLSLPEPKIKAGDGKPRSAYDKNAEWYCGSEDEQGSVVSDGSSVLSAFRPKKTNPMTLVVPASEASMDLGALLRVEEQESSKSLKALEESMGLNFLQDQCHSASILEFLSNEGEESRVYDSDLMNQPIEPIDFTDVEPDGFGVSEREMMNQAIEPIDFMDVETEEFRVSQREIMSQPIDLVDLTDVERPKQQESVPRSFVASETETSSRAASVPSVASHTTQEELENAARESTSNKPCSKLILKWIIAAVISTLIIDIVLLSIFLSRRR